MGYVALGPYLPSPALVLFFYGLLGLPRTPTTPPSSKKKNRTREEWGT